MRPTDRIRGGSTPPRHLLVEAAFCAVAFVALGLLALGMGANAGLGHVDLAALRVVQDAATTAVVGAMQAVSDIASTDELMLATAGAAVVLVARRHWHGAGALILSVLATQAIVALLKPLFERDRPPDGDALVEAAGYSFPSAHSASSVALYGVLALIAAHELRGRGRAWAVVPLVAVCAAVGMSRIYLGAHYPSDVLAGWLVGAVIALGSWRAALTLRGLRPGPAAV